MRFSIKSLLADRDEVEARQRSCRRVRGPENYLLIIMVYPQYKNKHAEAALFNPEDYVNWKKIKKGPIMLRL